MSEPLETPKSNTDPRIGGQDISVTNPVPIDAPVGGLPVDLSGEAIADAGPGVDGWDYVYTTSADMSGAAADLTAAPTAGQKLVISDILVSCDTDMVLTLKEETSGTVIGVLDMASNAPVQWTPRGKWKLPVADKKLQGQASAAGNIYITMFYYSEA